MDMRRLSQRAGLLVCCLLSTTAFAQTAGSATDAAWKTIQAAAVKEGRVVLYTEEAPGVTARLKAEFEKAVPGIVVEHTRLVGAPLTSKPEEERASGADGADMVFGAQVMVWYEQAQKQGLIKAPVGPSARAFPAQYLLGGAVPVLSLTPLVMAYNTSIAKTPVTGYQDMLRPELKGKVGIAEPAAASFVAWYDFLEKTQGAGFLEKLAANNPRIYLGGVPGTQAAASGEIGLFTITVAANIVPLAESGAPLKMAMVNPSLGIRWAGAILSHAKRPNAAQVFMDYLMSPRGQLAYHGLGQSASPLTGIAGSLDARTITAYDPKAYGPEVVKAFQERWNKLFKP